MDEKEAEGDLDEANRVKLAGCGMPPGNCLAQEYCNCAAQKEAEEELEEEDLDEAERVNLGLKGFGGDTLAQV